MTTSNLTSTTGAALPAVEQSNVYVSASLPLPMSYSGSTEANGGGKGEVFISIWITWVYMMEGLGMSSMVYVSAYASETSVTNNDSDRSDRSISWNMVEGRGH
ncbi:hypothetical protein BD770DRAFT_449546 [Pilaira anomala]|nr:hypothetical protein BD770DRAFT_449546 [Pilaira anomala]